MDYTLYRTVEAADAAPYETQTHGINLAGYRTANIQVIPDGGPVSISVLSWSPGALAYIPAAEPLDFGPSADPYEVTVPANGRQLLIVASAACQIWVAGFDVVGEL